MNKIEKYPFFITSVYKKIYPEADTLKKNILPFLKNYEINNPLESKQYSFNGYTSYYSNKNIVDDIPLLDDFIKWLKDAVETVHSESGLRGHLELSESWFSVNRIYSYHASHHHLPSVWSCVYYIQSNEETDANLIFHSPWSNTLWPFSKEADWNEETNQHTSVKCESGSLWIFPAYLYHEVEQQLSYNERITFAFNFNLKEK